MQVLWNLRGLAAPSLASNDDDSIFFQRPQDFILMRGDGQSVFLLPQGEVTILVVHAGVRRGSVRRSVEGRCGAARLPEAGHVVLQSGRHQHCCVRE